MRATCSRERRTHFVTRHVFSGIGGNNDFSRGTILCHVGTRSGTVRGTFAQDNVSFGMVNNATFCSEGRIGSILTCLRLVGGGHSSVHLHHVVGRPGHSVNSAAMGRTSSVTHRLNVSVFRMVRRTSRCTTLSHTTVGVGNFYGVVSTLARFTRRTSVDRLFARIVGIANCGTVLRNRNRRNESQLRGIVRLSSGVLRCRLRGSTPALSRFLRRVTLVDSVSNLSNSGSGIILVAMRSTGKLRFRGICLINVRRNVFPNRRSVVNKVDRVRRRHHLVCITVAHTGEHLFIAGASAHVLCKHAAHGLPSHFIGRVPLRLYRTANIDAERCGVAPVAGGCARASTGESTFVGSAGINDASMCGANVRVGRGAFNINVVLGAAPVNGSALLRVTFSGMNAGGIVTKFTGLAVVWLVLLVLVLC